MPTMEDSHPCIQTNSVVSDITELLYIISYTNSCFNVNIKYLPLQLPHMYLFANLPCTLNYTHPYEENAYSKSPHLLLNQLPLTSFHSQPN